VGKGLSPALGKRTSRACPTPSTVLAKQRVAEIDTERPVADPRSPGPALSSAVSLTKASSGTSAFHRPWRDVERDECQGGGRDAGGRNAENQPPDAGEKCSQGIEGGFQEHPIAILVCCGLIVLGAVVWYLHARHYESTDDAFIDARPVLVSPQVTGDLISVNVTDDQILKT
jgi:hypothetical protein